MFTGIIESIGSIRALTPKGGDVRVHVATGKLDLTDVKLGDSIATNGVCLTVVALGDKSYTADVSLETLSRTGFAEAKVGDPVNLEKALMPSSRLGGHLVSGHVDGIGEVVQKDRIEVDVWAWGKGLQSWLIDHIVIDGGPGDPAATGRFAVPEMPNQRAGVGEQQQQAKAAQPDHVPFSSI